MDSPYLPGKFVWFEHLSGDVAKARGFYRELFGWVSDPVPVGDQQYPLIQNGSCGIGGFREAPAGMRPQWLGYLSVEDVDAAAQAAASRGARVLMGPADFPPVGRGATLADPQGAVFAIWRSTQGDRPDQIPTPPGDWCWNELMTDDDGAALAFYQGCFGFERQSKDMGPAGTYHLLVKGGTMRAGLMKYPPGMNYPAAWTPYVAVADCDALAARAAGLGANVLVPPADIPEVGRFSVIADPLGAPLGMLRFAGP